MALTFKCWSGFLVLAVLFLGPESTQAQNTMYKCTVNGRPVYQDTPCASEPVIVTIAPPGGSFEGCYEVTFPPHGTESPSVEAFEVRPKGGQFELRVINRKGDSNSKAPTPKGLPLKRATAKELRDIGVAFGLELTSGLSAADSSPNYKPVGIYLGTDEKGDSFFLAYFFFASGRAKPIPCVD